MGAFGLPLRACLSPWWLACRHNLEVVVSNLNLHVGKKSGCPASEDGIICLAYLCSIDEKHKVRPLGLHK